MTTTPASPSVTLRQVIAGAGDADTLRSRGTAGIVVAGEGAGCARTADDSSLVRRRSPKIAARFESRISRVRGRRRRVGQRAAVGRRRWRGRRPRAGVLGQLFT